MTNKNDGKENTTYTEQETPQKKKQEETKQILKAKILENLTEAGTFLVFLRTSKMASEI